MSGAHRLPAVALGILLAWGVLTLGVPGRWAWAVFQIGVFLLAGWRVLRGGPWALAPAVAPLAGASLWPFLQLAFHTTVYRGATWSAALDWGTFLLVFVLAQDLLGDAAARRWFLPAAIVFGMALAIAATIGRFTCPGRVFCLYDSGFQADVMGPFVNRNQFCAWMELLLPASLYLAAAQPRARALYATAAAIMIGAVTASASRAGAALIAAEAVVVIALLLARRGSRLRRRAFGVVQLSVLIAIGVGVAGWQEVSTRWRESGPEELRRDAWQASFEMVQARPWTGSGLGTWSRMYPRYASLDRGVFMNQAHNDWVQWAAEGGLPFFLFFFFFAALSCKPAIQSIYGVGMVAFLLHALVDYPMQQRPALAAWFFCFAGVAGAWRSDRRRTP